MKKAIWFSRHQPTPAQLDDAARIGYDIIVTPEGTKLGAMELKDEGDVRACVYGLLGAADEQWAAAIFGVFPVPILALIARTSDDIRQRGEYVAGDIRCFASWNVARPAENGKPTFQHKQWLRIGRLNQDSCRWLGKGD
jgi:hypothetical protein